MAISLASEPNLASMVITSDAVYDHRLLSPNGDPWPDYTVGSIIVTNRAGAPLGTFDAEVGVGQYATAIRWVIQPEDLVDIPDGANFEVYVTILDTELNQEFTYKLQYGRVVRRQVTFPANPANSTIYTGALFTDSVGLRDTLGPLWIQQANKTVMHNNSPNGLPYGMGNDWLIFDNSAVAWYSPLKSDTQKVQVSIFKPPTVFGIPYGGGGIVVKLCANYNGTNWLGILFDCTNNQVRVVSGNTSGPNLWIERGGTVGWTVANTPDTFTISFDYPTRTLRCFHGTTLVTSFVDVTNVVTNGDGHRYTGLIYQGDLLTIGPQVSYWSAKDDL